MKIKFLIMFTILAITASACQPAAPEAPPTAVPVAPTAPPNTLAPHPTEEPFIAPALCTLMGRSATLDVPANKPVRLRWGWSAATEQKIQDFLDANVTVVTLDGQPVEGVQDGGIISTHGQYAVIWKKKIDDGTSTYGPGGKTEASNDRCELVVK